ncbi:MAG TPA: cysteine--tRNA ligase [Deltaproteobacteria bacterium]|nr:cysteine--tRNA ligase [Deltaproteobacteria bacterium]
MRVCRTVLELIGSTPMVEIRRLNPNPRVRILAKLESFNPGGSVKDRIALRMIEEAERRGELTPEKVILEATSGNTGIGLAMVAAVKGYRVLLLMPESVSEERQRILRAYGAEIRLTPSELGTDGAIEEAYRLAREEPDRYFLTDQFNNPSNPLAHYLGTAEEIWQQTGGKVDAVVIAMGTTGTIMGVARRLKEYDPRIRVIGVEPKMGHRIQGLKNLKESYVPGIFQRELIDEKIVVEDEEAFEMSRRLAREEGILVGMSSGAAMWAAARVAERMSEGVVVTVFADTGERYLSTSLFVEKPALSLRLYNTLSRTLEPLRPQEPRRVRIYTCGPTVSGLLHLGEWRRLLVADLLKRYLEYRGLEVIHVVNITDVDDRTIAQALTEGTSLEELTQRFTREFFQDAEALRLKPATHCPRASQHVGDMIRLAERLLKKGYAYERHHSLYFSLERFKDYGKLSGVDPKKVRVGATVDLDSYDKDNPRDFTLFKRSSLKELKAGVFYDTPWGKARPSWHIECAAMATKYLGDTVDVHTSSAELVFPHNENEIAIVEAVTGKPFALCWLHVAEVMASGRRMSREASNAVTLRELLEKGFSGSEVRYFLLGTHYRKPLQFSLKNLLSSRRALGRLDDFVLQVTYSADAPEYGPLKELLERLREEFEASMDDDLNVSRALAAVFSFLKALQPVAVRRGLSSADREAVLDALKKVDSVLAVMDFPQPELRRKVRELVERRESLRTKGEYPKADLLRKELLQLGVEVMDTPQGPVLRRPRSS